MDINYMSHTFVNAIERNEHKTICMKHEYYELSLFIEINGLDG